MKKTIAIILAILMLLPCVLTAAYAFSPADEENFGIMPGYARIKAVHKSADGTTWAMASTYNKAGLLTKTVEVEKSDFGTTKTTTAFAYDKNGNVKKKAAKTVDADGWSKEVTAYAYNKNGDVKKTVYTYEGSGNYSEKITSTYTYDRSGKLVKVVAKRSGLGGDWTITTTYDYDAAGRKIKEDQFNPYSMVQECVREYGYDAAGNLNRISYAEYGTDYEYHSTQTLTYDKQGNLTKETFRDTDSNNETVTTYTYDKNGRLKKQATTCRAQVYGDGYTETTAYSYDKNGNLTKEVVKFENAFGVKKTAIAYAYDANGNLCKKVIARTGTHMVGPEKDVWAYTYQKIAA